MLSSLAALALAAIASAQDPAWHMDSLFTLVTERLDPIVSPNAIGGHMHSIVGGSNFGASYNYDHLFASACTTTAITVDKSNYWMPKLYWINNGGSSFTPLPEVHRFYYFLSRNSPNQTVTPWPRGLRMLVGDPDAKTANSESFGFTCHVNSDLFTGDINSDNFNFDRDCPWGMRVDAEFPQCWDGLNLYLPGNAHMTYTDAGSSFRDGSCPWSHPVRLPQLMLEYTFGPSAWAQGVALAGNLAWANGDTTGYGVHADFTNG